MRKIILFVMFLSGLLQTVSAQDSTKHLKNTILFNVTNPIIFGSSFILGYERVLNHRHSFSVNIGTTSFPGSDRRDTDSLKVNDVDNKSGMNISADFRFYLSKENKYAAPRGVYIGPYYSYNNFKREHSWILKSTNGGAPLEVKSELTLNVHTIGFEMGYQFVFWDRMALNMILLGPGISAYNLKASLANNLSQADRERLFEAINDALADKFPGYDVAINQGEFQKKGSTNSTNLGYRYMVQIGFRF
ncbi:MAG TPA: hypothetical protein VGQ04_19735 [Chitinophagaceae bacterium]|jgi:hypothetical protein|nr:hypothetical protein [Chitinophagaceae bacterium]